MNLMKQKRTEMKMTQIEAAIACGVSLAGYIMWEKGVGKPAKERREKVIEVMGLPEDYFEEK
jgi:transcriptional regulator with XRE-family HTH domain